MRGAAGAGLDRVPSHPRCHACGHQHTLRRLLTLATYDGHGNASCSKLLMRHAHVLACPSVFLYASAYAPSRLGAPRLSSIKIGPSPNVE